MPLVPGCNRRLATLSRCFPSNRSNDLQEVVLFFGEHKGKAVSQLSDGYLQWMQATLESSWWKKVASSVLEDRKRQKRAGTRSRKQALLQELKLCSSARNLTRGKAIHLEALETGSISCNYVATALVNMYAKCRSMVEARRVFDGMERPDVVSWTAIILGYAEEGEAETALELLEGMKSQGCTPNSYTYVAALKACTSLALQQRESGKAECLRRGRLLHSEIGCHSDVYVQSSLIDMYAKCGEMVEAGKVFEAIKHPNLVCWNALLLGYADNGDGVTALDLFAEMKSEGCEPDSFTFVAAVKACTSLAVMQDEAGRRQALERGREIHLGVGSGMNNYVQNTLIDMYSKCRDMVEARQVFDSIKHPDLVSWNALILGYAENGEGVTALDLFEKMKRQGNVPDSATFLAALKACTALALQQQQGCRSAEWIEQGRRIHSEIGGRLSVSVQNTLIDMYSKFGCMVEARRVFDGIKEADVVSWTTLILGYAENEEGLTALDLVSRMKTEGCEPNSVTFIAALKACKSLAFLQDGSGRAECLKHVKRIHSEIKCPLDIYLQNTLVDTYAKCGSTSEARRVFDTIKQPDVVSWNALIMGHAEAEEGLTALNLFERMQCAGCVPNSVSFIAALKALASLAQDESSRAECLERGRKLHSDVSLHLIDLCLENTLVDMYAKCGSIIEARRVFDGIKTPDVVSWNTLILGHAENGECGVALELFKNMRSRGCTPNSFTFVAALKACSLLGALEIGKEIHAEIDSGAAELNPILITSLVDFYAKCGCMMQAQDVFDSNPRTRSPMTWTALLAGYSRLGDCKSAFKAFEGMQDAGCEPDRVTFLCILTCCSHAGLVQEANEFFEVMSAKYAITPTLEHYTCMVDLLARSNKLHDAVGLLRRMPYVPDSLTWMTVLAACRKWKNVEIGRIAFKALVALNDKDAAAYVVMAHIYGARGMWEEQETVLVMRRRFKVWKEPGQSCWTNELGEVYVFLAGGQAEVRHQKHEHPLSTNGRTSIFSHVSQILGHEWRNMDAEARPPCEKVRFTASLS